MALSDLSDTPEKKKPFCRLCTQVGKKIQFKKLFDKHPMKNILKLKLIVTYFEGFSSLD